MNAKLEQLSKVVESTDDLPTVKTAAVAVKPVAAKPAPTAASASKRGSRKGTDGSSTEGEDDSDGTYCVGVVMAPHSWIGGVDEAVMDVKARLQEEKDVAAERLKQWKLEEAERKRAEAEREAVSDLRVRFCSGFFQLFV